MSLAPAAHSHSAYLGQRRARSLESARRRTRFIAALRIALLAAMALLTLNLVIQIVLSANQTAEETLEGPAGDIERIVNPRFTGRDRDGTPFVVTAESAIRRPGDVPGLTELEQPRLDYELLRRAGSEPGEVLARSGLYNPQTNTLRLDSEVRLATQSGYRFETDSAMLDLEDSAISGDHPVYGEAPWGAIRAGRFEVRDNGAHVIFSDGVRTRLYVEESDGGAETENGE